MDELSAEQPMTFTVSGDGSSTVTVAIRGELDIAGIDALRRAVDPALRRGPARLVLELGELSFADTSAIALWVRWSSLGPRLELRHVPPLLHRVIAAMGLAERLGVAG